VVIPARVVIAVGVDIAENLVGVVIAVIVDSAERVVGVVTVVLPS
jgi:hypothetical protein